MPVVSTPTELAEAFPGMHPDTAVALLKQADAHHKDAGRPRARVIAGVRVPGESERESIYEITRHGDSYVIAMVGQEYTSAQPDDSNNRGGYKGMTSQ